MKKAKKTSGKDEENYIGYVAKDHHAEAGYSLKNAFEAQASSAVLDLTGDDENQMKKKKQMMRWDNKKKKYVRAEQVKFLFQYGSGFSLIEFPAKYTFLAAFELKHSPPLGRQEKDPY